MELKLFYSLWGESASLSDAATFAKSSGFDGIEAPAPHSDREQSQLQQTLESEGLLWIQEIATGGGYVPNRAASPSQHLDELASAFATGKSLGALHANCITGCDAWPFEQQLAFFSEAQQLLDSLGVSASFETHRSRSLYNPWATRDISLKLPELRFTCDLSHWCVVCERLLEEQDVFEQIFPRTHHIHGRVGYDQGPQVTHPGAPEHAQALASHTQWWQQIWENAMMRQQAFVTMTPEFGPDGYLHTLPFTNAPVAELKMINLWMAKYLRDTFNQWRIANEDE